ncbi:hypothetical protein CWB72_12675 [Pseudoalteromonas phenolica]|nr:hypothetical protein CWB72_12675 [Pseudoalteromonas phenolica]
MALIMKKPVLLLGPALGAIIGFGIAKYQIAQNIQAMQEYFGWVCGTGLDLPMYIWIPVGSITGFVFAKLFLRFNNLNKSA